MSHIQKVMKRSLHFGSIRRDQVIGYWEDFEKRGESLVGRIKLATTNLGQMIKELISSDVPLSASIGFMGKGKPNKKGGVHFTEIELLECSIVSIPSNPAAIRIAKHYGMEDCVENCSIKGEVADAAQDLEMRAYDVLKAAAKILDSTQPQTKTIQKGHSMKLSEKIVAAQEEINTIKDTLVENVKALEENPEDEATLNTIDALNDEIESKTKSLEALQKAEAALGRQAVPVEKSYTSNHQINFNGFSRRFSRPTCKISCSDT